MTQKVRKILIMVVMAALIICLMAASLTYTFTYGRYAGGKFDNENSPYGDLIEFVGANQYTVRTPEELIQAIEDGYSNIKIADDAEEPFVIDTGVTDVSANLVLDLNGTNVIRNSRNPLLDVKEEVSVVLVYDSSKTAGSFYNPVGSNLQVSGGTLTVAVGDYISGPEDGEYNTETTSASQVTLFARNKTDRADSTGYTPDSEVGALPDISTNKYFEEVDTGTTFNGTYIKDDTFLLYTVERDCFVEDNTLYTNAEKTEEDGSEVAVVTGEALTVACNVASCDFYYYYPIGGTTGTAEVPQDYAVIYGYNDVKTLAEGQYDASTEEYKSFYNQADLVWPYAAVRMVESDNAAQDDNAAQGEGFARGGNFYNYFDTVNTYGIYAESGSLVASGNVKFSTGGDGVCIRCEGDADLDVSGGEFSSEIGNTIEMSGGNMTVTKGTFKKSGGKGIGSGGNDQVANQTAMIDMQGGTLNVSGTKTDDTYSVTMTAGGTDNGGTLENVFGILAHGGGEVSVGGCTFNINGNYSAGVLSYDGTINLNDNTVINVTETHPDNQLTSAGVSSERDDTSETSSSAGSHPINMKGNVTIISNGLGITARGKINVQSGTTTVKTEVTVTTENATGIVVSGDADEKNGEQQATLTVEGDATLSVESTIKSSLKWVNAPGHEGTGDTNVNNGIYVENGSIDASAGTLNVTHTGVAGDAPDNNSTTGAATKSYAVFVKGDAESGSQNTTVSIGAGTITGTKAGGVYVVGTSKQDGEQTTYTATVTLGGVTINAQNTYAAGILTETGNVIINGNAHITSSALGIAVINGNVGISADSTDSSVKATRATGVYVRGGTLYNRGTLSVESDLADENNNNLFYQHTGADISTPSTDPNPYNGVYVKGGSLNSTGTLNVTFTGVQNDARGTSGSDQSDQIVYDGENTSFLNQQTKSYAVRVEAEEGVDPIVTIASGNITNSVGGGVLVNGGTVTLGKKETTNGDTTYSGPTVQTTGTEVNTSPIRINGMADNWAYYWNMKGGDAVKVDGGELAVYGGTYKAAQGNGILTRGGTANIYDGTFTGGYNSTYHATTGAASTYSFKAYGGTVNISGGNFDSDAEGAFVMGTSESDKVTITGGSFQAKGPTAFATWNGATVEFDDTNSKNKIIVSGESTGLTVEQVSSGGRSQKITIKSATFESTNQRDSNKNGIWYGNGNATLTISGGIFKGTTGSGLRIDASPRNNIQLSGGTYNGSNGAINAKNPGSISTGNILGDSAWCFAREPKEQNDHDAAIVTYYWSEGGWQCAQIGKSNSVALNYTENGRGTCSWAYDGGNRHRLNEYPTIVIRTGEQMTFWHK